MASPRDLILQLAQRYRLDPAAVLAVARGEGGLGWGKVGDGGHAFGPFQLNDAGGVITGRPGDHAAFANSPAGLEFAMRKMAESGAAGLTGEAAVNKIIRQFERPRDPDSSVRNAVGRLEQNLGGAPAPVAASSPAPTVAPDGRREFATSLLGATRAGGGLDTRALLNAVLARRAATSTQIGRASCRERV